MCYGLEIYNVLFVDNLHTKMYICTSDIRKCCECYVSLLNFILQLKAFECVLNTHKHKLILNWTLNDPSLPHWVSFNIWSALSRWCISHRKRAKQIVETWDKLFKSAQKEQRVSFLYLSNDILQNSRRKGSEFVNEFWKILPATLKNVYESGDENGKKAASRLVSP